MTFQRIRVIAPAIAGGMMLSACALGSKAPPVTTYTLLAAAPDTPPITVAAPLNNRRVEGTQYNQWGGIVPEAKPTIPVDDGGLGEITN